MTKKPTEKKKKKKKKKKTKAERLCANCVKSLECK